MLPIDINTLVPCDINLIDIISSYKVLHYDDFPILYIGVNKFGNKVLGSHLEEDDGEGIIWTIHSILSNTEYYDFVNKRRSYKEVLKGTTTKYLVKGGFNGKILEAFSIAFE